MATKPQIALSLAAATTFAVSLGAGTYLAHRSSRPESTPAGQAVSETPAPVTQPPAPEIKTLTSTSASLSGNATGKDANADRVADPKPPPPAPAPAPKRAAAPPPVSSPARNREERAVAPRATSERVTSSTPQPLTNTVVPPPSDPPVTTSVSTATVDPPPVPEPAKPRFEEIVVKTDSVIGIRIDQTISSDTAKVEDRVTGRVARDVTVDGRTVLPVGGKLEGVVAVVERGGKIRERARVGLKFNMLIMPDGLRVPIQTDTIFREGESPVPDAGKKIGTGAVGGAILGAVLGGKKGAAIGTAVAAPGAPAAVMAGGRSEAVFTTGSPWTVRLTAPVTITIERDPSIR